MGGKTVNEIETVKLVQSGNIEAFEKLFDKYKTSAIRTVYLITGNIHTSEDIVQEAFIKCYCSIKSLKNVESFKSWFFKILVRIAWNYSNREKNLIPIDNIYEEADNASIDKSIDNFIQNERNSTLYDEIDKLELKQKTVIVLYYFNDMSISEIAKAMGCFEGTVKSRLYKARKNLKSALQHSIKDSGEESGNDEIFKII